MVHTRHNINCSSAFPTAIQKRLVNLFLCFMNHLFRTGLPFIFVYSLIFLSFVSRVPNGALICLDLQWHGYLLLRMAATVKEKMAVGQFAMARKTWIDLLDLIDYHSNSVNMENFLLDTSMNPILENPSSLRSSQLMSQVSPAANTIDAIMNGVIKKKLMIIPKNLIWQEASIQVHDALANTFMKPAINEVDALLAYGVNVTVYNGQLDVICPTIGVEAWVKKLKWDGLKNFLSLPRDPLRYRDSSKHLSRAIEAYVRSYKSLNFYWILLAGHMVPVDQRAVALGMISSIIESPDN